MERYSCEAYVTLMAGSTYLKSHCFGYFLGIASASQRGRGEPKPENHAPLRLELRPEVSKLNQIPNEFPRPVKASGRVILR
jgi:hypothetical protein